MVKALMEGRHPEEVIRLASRRLKASRDEMMDALQGELTAVHRFVLDELMQHIEDIEARIRRFDQKLLEGLSGAEDALRLLQTIRPPPHEFVHQDSFFSILY